MELFKAKIDALRLIHDQKILEIEQSFIRLTPDQSILIQCKPIEEKLDAKRMAEYINDAIIPVIKKNRVQISQAHD